MDAHTYGVPMGMQQMIPTTNNSRGGLAVQAPRRQLEPTSWFKGDYQYVLTSEQQPVRARMCGFGDKDRRPITPPPCVRLRVKRRSTGEYVDVGELPYQYYVLQVDIWDETGSHEVNLVRHSSNSPAMSISAATTTSFPPQPDRVITVVTQVPTAALMQGVTLPQNSYVAHHGIPPPGHASTQGQPPTPPGSVPPQPFVSQAVQPPMYASPNNPTSQPVGSVYPHMAMTPYMPNGIPNGMPNIPGMPPHPHQITIGHMPLNPHSQGMFTRNLIGSTTVNACKLKDDQDEWGLWFVLQDLSVRTEGSFRLKYSFVDLHDATEQNNLVQTYAEVLATCYSDMFRVYSAKKFPGVIESTPLSKAFAQQGIKIPIRKDVKVANSEEYDDEVVGMGNGSNGSH